MIAKRELLKLVELACNRNAHVFLDQTFIEFTDEPDSSLSSHVEEFPNLFVARSLTKTFALTGLRIGYGLASRRLTSQLRRVKMPWSVNVLAQEAAIAALRDKPYLEKSRKLIARERDFLYSELKTIHGLTPFRPEANFILLRITRGLTAKQLKTSLLDKHILIRDCSSFRGLRDNYFRIAVKLRNQNRHLLSTLKDVFN
jgi:threonine-phosphate decarboxylase